MMMMMMMMLITSDKMPENPFNVFGQPIMHVVLVRLAGKQC